MITKRLKFLNLSRDPALESGGAAIWSRTVRGLPEVFVGTPQGNIQLTQAGQLRLPGSRQVSIEDYGASSANDDNAAAIQAAIDDAVSGDEIIIPDSYDFKSQIRIVDKALVLRGLRGPGSYLQPASTLRYTGAPTGLPVIEFERTPGTYEGQHQGMRDLRVTTTQSDAHGVRFNAALIAMIENVEIAYFQGDDAYGLDLGGQSSFRTADAVYVADISGPTFTTRTTEWNNDTVSDVEFPAVEEVGDYIAVGSRQKFDWLTLVLGTAGVGGTIAIKYWNGSTWVAVSGLIDGTSNLTSAGTFFAPNEVTFTMPTNWATTTVGSDPTPRYYLRLEVATTYSTNPQISRGRIARQAVLALDVTMMHVELNGNRRGLLLCGNDVVMLGLRCDQSLDMGAHFANCGGNTQWIGGVCQGGNSASLPGVRITRSTNVEITGVYFELTQASAGILVEDSCSQIIIENLHGFVVTRPTINIAVHDSNWIFINNCRHFASANPADRTIRAENCNGLYINGDVSASSYGNPTEDWVELINCSEAYRDGIAWGGHLGASPAHVFNGGINVPGPIAIGSAPAATGTAIRLTAGDTIFGKNGGGADTAIIQTVSSFLVFGSPNWTSGVYVDGDLHCRPDAGNDVLTLTTTLATISQPLAVGSGTKATTGDIRGNADFSIWARDDESTNYPIIVHNDDTLAIGDSATADRSGRVFGTASISDFISTINVLNSTTLFGSSGVLNIPGGFGTLEIGTTVPATGVIRLRTNATINTVDGGTDVELITHSAAANTIQFGPPTLTYCASLSLEPTTASLGINGGANGSYPLIITGQVFSWHGSNMWLNGASAGTLGLPATATIYFGASPFINVSGTSFALVGNTTVPIYIDGPNASTSITLRPDGSTERLRAHNTGVEILGYLTVGTTPAGTGTLRFPATANIMGRANSADALIIDWGGNAVVFGSSAFTGGVYIDSSASPGVTFRPGGGTTLVLSSTLATFSVPAAFGATVATQGDIRLSASASIRGLIGSNTRSMLTINSGQLVLGDTNTDWTAVTIQNGSTSGGEIQLEVGGVYALRADGFGGNPRVGLAGAAPTSGVVNSALPYSSGTNPALSGQIRIPNNTFISQRNAANNADIGLIGLDVNNTVLLGNGGTAGFQVNATGSFTTNTSNITFISTVVSPVISQSADTGTGTVSADSLTLEAQAATGNAGGNAKTAGTLNLLAGSVSGTGSVNTGGSVNITAGAATGGTTDNGGSVLITAGNGDDADGTVDLIAGDGALKLRINTTGIGAFNVTPVARPTVAGTVITATAGTALRSFLDALDSLGWINDTSTDA